MFSGHASDMRSWKPRRIESGNAGSYETDLAMLRNKLEVAEAYVAHIESRHDVAFGGIK
jgi:hypothetical protein